VVPLIAAVWVQTARHRHWKVVCYMALAWIGDAALLADEKAGLLSWTVAGIGALSFALSHALCISYSDVRPSPVPIHAWALIAPLLAVALPPFRFDTGEEVMCVAYCAAVARSTRYASTSASFVLVLVGYFCFLMSHVILIRRVFNVEPRPQRVEVLSTYIIAQMCIVFGMACGAGS